jgi:maleate isomerase
MHGWRSRIGLIVPSSNTTMESELWSSLPDGVSLHTARVPLTDVNAWSLERMEEHSKEAAGSLMDAEVDCILFGCTSGSLIKGAEHNLSMSQEMEDMLGVPFVTTSTAVVEALRSLDMKEIAVVTPYIDEVNEKEKRFLEDNGFEVLSVRGMGLERNREIGERTAEESYRFARENFVRSDGLFVSCTNLRTFGVIDVLERDLGTNVVTSNQASLWLALERAGVRERIEGLGRLLAP